MTEPLNHDITELLRSWKEGDETALEKLTQATALVNEAYVRLIDWHNVQWQNRAHFFGVVAQLMRRVLVDYARSRRYDKRGGGVRPLNLDEAPPVADDKLSVLVEIDEALNRLAAIDARKAQIVELRYFGGLTVEETAQALNVSTITVIRSWNFARAWLLRELAEMTIHEP